MDGYWQLATRRREQYELVLGEGQCLGWRELSFKTKNQAGVDLGGLTNLRAVWKGSFNRPRFVCGDRPSDRRH